MRAARARAYEVLKSSWMNARALRARVRDWAKATDLELIAALLLVALFAWSFIELSDAPGEMNRRSLVALREPGDLSRGIGGHHVEGMVRDLTSLGSATLAILFAGSFVGWLLLTGRPGAALFVTLAMLGAWGLNVLLKVGFARERPDVVPYLDGASDPSFPSGHTMISAVLYPTMAGMLGRLVQARSVRFYLMGVALAIAVLVAFSRLYLGVHYPSDVLGGLVAGFAWALACGIVARVLQRRRVFRSRPVPQKDAADALP